MNLYQSLLRPLLFQFDPESVHHFTATGLRAITALPGAELLLKGRSTNVSKAGVRTCFGLNFPNPVGLAAGFDKDAKLVDAMAALGFGHVEVGTLTPRPQAGNPKPRLFRLPKDQAILNRMGFNNEGVEAAARRLANRRSSVIVGGNIGKNKDTPNEEAVQDYLKCFRVLEDVVDYFVVNVSSPNTPGLRELQEKEPLKKLLLTLQEVNQKRQKPRPLLLKIAPDLSPEQLDDIAEIAIDTNLAGLIANNTTISRKNLLTSAAEVEALGAGGISGKPVREKSLEVMRQLRKTLPKSIALIGVGGIMTAADAEERLAAGADLVQLYTGFIYEGPGLIGQINRSLG
jgi:dihydroorotate dehydrogenase